MCEFPLSLIFPIPHRILIITSKYFQKKKKKKIQPHTSIMNLPSVFPYRNYIWTSWSHCKPLFLLCLENNRQCDPGCHLVFQLLMWFCLISSNQWWLLQFKLKGGEWKDVQTKLRCGFVDICSRRLISINRSISSCLDFLIRYWLLSAV